jgi:hypothetical protein
MPPKFFGVITSIALVADYARKKPAVPPDKSPEMSDLLERRQDATDK